MLLYNMPRPRTAPDLAGALIGVAPLATRWIERLLAGNEPPLTLAQFLALRAIAAESVTAAELARRAGVSGAAVSQLVGALEQAGWIERSRGEDDRRRQALSLTPAGAEVFRSATRRLRSRLGELLAPVPRREAEQLARLLERLEHTLGGAPPPRRPPPPPPRRP
jgi:MarR family transcriptional regulator, lower aerobic nicotinate degradation pathway regulator